MFIPSFIASNRQTSTFIAPRSLHLVHNHLVCSNEPLPSSCPTRFATTVAAFIVSTQFAALSYCLEAIKSFLYFGFFFLTKDEEIRDNRAYEFLLAEFHSLGPQYNSDMDLNSDDSAVNLDDDRDLIFSDSSSSIDDEIHNENDRVIDSDDEVNEEEVDSDEGNDNMDAEVGRGVSRRIIDLTSDDISALEFCSENDAFNFYFSYARCHGFAVRRDDVIKDSKGMLIMRQFLCSRAGKRDKKHLIRLDRKKEHRPLTRTNCQAKLRVRFDYKTGKYKVVSFLDSHNHELTPAKFVPLIPAYRGLSDGDKAQVDALHSHGVRPCQIMGFLVDKKGGYRNVGFSKKDLYNYINMVKRGRIKDKDAVAGLSYLQGKADNNPMFFSRFLCSDDGKLTHLFWCDEIIRADYQFFGDVLAFDATYKKNRYKYPLVIFSGKNHHSQTFIFGCALIADETINTYKWVLRMFSEAMFNKHPATVVTDGDGAMREAIKVVFPNASHRLCG
ncbi:MULE transposase domain [Sesbania bispinosa]|nr:MULE transposase domain [Sesbania bispinosa]